MYFVITTDRADNTSVVEAHNLDANRGYIEDPMVPALQTFVVPTRVAHKLVACNKGPGPLTYHGPAWRQVQHAFELIQLLILAVFPDSLFDDFYGNHLSPVREFDVRNVKVVREAATQSPSIFSTLVDRYILTDEFPAITGVDFSLSSANWTLRVEITYVE